jgi:hypothetical protein
LASVKDQKDKIFILWLNRGFPPELLLDGKQKAGEMHISSALINAMSGVFVLALTS